MALWPPQLLVRMLARGPASFVLPQLWHRALCRILSIEVERRGAIDALAAIVYVGNHVSHFDIFAVGSCVRAAFIAKGEMARWPGMRLLGAMQQTLFVSRRARDASRVATQVRASRRDGRRLVLFAEGTTSNGIAVAPFKSSLFSVLVDGSGADGSVAALQPFTLEIIATDGRALDDGGDRDLYALHGDMDAGRHVLRFLRSRGAHVRISFHPTLRVAEGATRKSVAAASHATVAAGLRHGP
jgi:1-acyl-sn-glycerol-3-phosphate acyltransferase